jgi:hypothetical protein
MIDTLGQNPPSLERGYGIDGMDVSQEHDLLKLSFTGISVLPCILPMGAVWR